jgi:glycosyltransferase involved in cell wall biosynthesis
MKIALLICTRNRLSALDALLESISKSKLIPAQVIISSSGQNVSGVLWKYREKINITHIETELFGQIRQKMLGIDALDKSIDWTVFLDDDVLLPRDTLGKLQNLVEFRSSQNPKNLLGVGFCIPSTSHLQETETFKKAIARFFCLDSYAPGEILRSGHPVSYLNSSHIVDCKWLNGISAWNSKVLCSYGSDFLESRYSAYEDVIFSYRQSKFGQLIFDPNIKVDLQESLSTDLSQVSVFEAASYWRLKFILTNPEFSKSSYLWSQLGRSIFFILGSMKSKSGLLNRAYKCTLTFLEIIYQLTIKQDANWSLERHCKNGS